jgi:glycine cleavage system protein P-like pyridoxal-binding family
MNVDADIARRMAAQFDIAAEVEQVAHQVAISVQPRQSDIRRRMVFDIAKGNLDAAMAAGQDIDHELSVLGACVLEWKTSRLADVARCCCPLDPAAGSEDIIAVPECPAHGEGAA